MSTNNVCFYGAIRKTINTFWLKKSILFGALNSFSARIWLHIRSTSSRMKTEMVYDSAGMFGHQAVLRPQGWLFHLAPFTRQWKNALTYLQSSMILSCVQDQHAGQYSTPTGKLMANIDKLTIHLPDWWKFQNYKEFLRNIICIETSLSDLDWETCFSVETTSHKWLQGSH